MGIRKKIDLEKKPKKIVLSAELCPIMVSEIRDELLSNSTLCHKKCIEFCAENTAKTSR